jgi:hypothetical protein
MNFLVFLLSSLIISSSFGQVLTFEELQKKLGYPIDTYKNEYLSENQKEAILSYINYDDPIYKEINGFLRGTLKEDQMWYYTRVQTIMDDVDLIDKAIAAVAPLPENLLLFRGSSLDYRDNKPYKIGEVFNDKAFYSTSVDLGQGYAFAGKMGVLYVTYSSKPYRDGILTNEIEHEVLIPRNQFYKVMDSFFDGKSWRQLIQRCQSKLSCLESVHIKTIKDWWKNHKELNEKDNS